MNLLKQRMVSPRGGIDYGRWNAMDAVGGGGGMDYGRWNSVTPDNSLALAMRMAQMGDEDQPQMQPMPDYFAKLPQQPDTQQGYNRLAALMGRRF